MSRDQRGNTAPYDDTAVCSILIALKSFCTEATSTSRCRMLNP